MADLVMTACLTSLSVDMLLSILKYMLVDGKVVVVSSDLSLLSLVGIGYFLFLCLVEGIRSMLFPFQWQLPFISIAVLTAENLSILQSSMPYLIGIPRDFMSIPSVYDPLHSYMLVDIDNSSVTMWYWFLCR